MTFRTAETYSVSKQKEKVRAFKASLFSSPLWRLTSSSQEVASLNPSDRGVPLVTFLSIKDSRKEPNRPLMQVLLLSHSSGAWAPAATFKRCLFCAEVFHPIAATHIGLNVLACSLPRQAQVGTARAACLGRDEGLAH